MSLPDPISVATLPDATNVAKIWSPNSNTAVYRSEFTDGSLLKFSFIQTESPKTGARHVVRMEYIPVSTPAVPKNPTVFTITISEPATGMLSNADALYFYKVLKNTLTDTVITQLLNQEL